MRAITASLSEIWHLFVEDGPFAAAIVLWPCLVWLLGRWSELAHSLGTTMLAIGMIVILVTEATHYASRARPR